MADQTTTWLTDDGAPRLSYDRTLGTCVLVFWGGVLLGEFPSLTDENKARIQEFAVRVFDEGRRAGKREVREALGL